MEPEYNDKSVKLFIGIMKIVMGILGVFSFCYIISSVGIFSLDDVLEKPETQPIVMENNNDDTKMSQNDIQVKDEALKEEPVVEFEKDTNRIEEKKSFLDTWASYLDQFLGNDSNTEKDSNKGKDKDKENDSRKESYDHYGYGDWDDWFSYDYDEYDSFFTFDYNKRYNFN